MRDETKLRQFLATVLSQEIHPLPKDEEWPDLIQRIKGGRNERVRRKTYWYFLEVLPPHYHGGDFFAFCEGREPLRLFAFLDGTYVARQLTWEETITFCTLAEIPLPH